jgi:hypothetical protein
MAGRHGQGRGQGFVDLELGLAAQVVAGPRVDIAECPKRLADAIPRVLQATADDRRERMEAEGEPGRHAEVAATAAEPPQQFGRLLLVGENHVSSGRDDLGGDQVVAGEAVLRGEVADPTAERKPSDSGRPNDAAGRDQAAGLRRGVEVEPGRAALGASEPCVDIDLDLPHPREVDHEAVVDGTMSGRVVAAAADGDLQTVMLGEVQGRRHVAGIRAPRDRRRPAVHQQVEAETRPRILGVGWLQHVAGERIAELGEVPGHRI